MPTPTMSVQCPNCGKSIKAPVALAGKERQCPGCHEPFTIPEQEPVRIAQTPKPKKQSDSFADLDEAPCRGRKPTSSNTTLLLVGGAAAALLFLIVGIVVVVAVASRTTPVANQPVAGANKPEIPKQPDPPQPDPKQQEAEAAKKAEETRLAEQTRLAKIKADAEEAARKAETDRKAKEEAWLKMVRSELAVVKAKLKPLQEQPSKPPLMTMEEYESHLQTYEEYANRADPDKVEPEAAILLPREDRLRVNRIIPRLLTVVVQEHLLRVAYEERDIMRLETRVMGESELRPLVSETYRTNLLKRASWNERKLFFKQFAKITGNKTPYTLLHPFDSLTRKEMDAAVDAAKLVQKSGLRSLNQQQRIALLATRAFDWYESQIKP